MLIQTYSNNPSVLQLLILFFHYFIILIHFQQDVDENLIRYLSYSGEWKFMTESMKAYAYPFSCLEQNVLEYLETFEYLLKHNIIRIRYSIAHLMVHVWSWLSTYHSRDNGGFSREICMKVIITKL